MVVVVVVVIVLSSVDRTIECFECVAPVRLKLSTDVDGH